MIRLVACVVFVFGLAGCQSIDWTATGARMVDSACAGSSSCTRLCPDGSVPASSTPRCPDPSGRTGFYLGGMTGRP